MLRSLPASLPVAARRLAAALLSGMVVLSLTAAAQADGALTLTHIAAEQFPALKTKVYNSNFAVDGAAGNAVIRSRYGTDLGSDGEKVFVYGYQLDLKDTYVVSGKPGVTAITLDFPAMPPFAAAEKLPEKTTLYVIDESDGDSGIALQSVDQQNGKLTFTFATTLRVGNQPGAGDHSVWFGFVSPWHAQRGNVLITSTGGTAQPPSAPSLAAGAKPATPQDSANDPAKPDIQVFMPVADQPDATQPGDKKPDTAKPATAPAAN